MTRSCCLAVLLTLLLCTTSFAATIHVPSEQPTIQAGIDAAVDGDTVLVAPGTYTENIDFLGKNIKTIGESGASLTIIEPANSSVPIVSFSSGESNDAELARFTVRNSGASHAVFIDGASPTIRGNVFRDNNFDAFNAALKTINDAAPIVHHNLFENNAGIANVSIESPARFYNNTIVNSQRAGIIVYDNGYGFVENNIIVGCPYYGLIGNEETSVDYNDIYANNPDYITTTPGPHDISADPLFVDPPGGAFALQPSSPCIDTGDPDPQYNDPDGTRNDMGAFPLGGFGDIVISDIPDQIINEGDVFAPIPLDDYVEDTIYPDDELEWSYSGNLELEVSIDANRIATITAPHPDWFGNETIAFQAVNPILMWGIDAATFTVTPVNDAPVIESIPDQVVRHHRPFPSFLLDDYVEDIDDPDSLLLWTYSGNTVLTVDIDAQRIVTTTPPSPDWTGTDTVIFTVTDTAMATDEDTVAFTRLENIPPEAPVLLSPTDDELVDTLFPVLTILNSYDDEDDSLIYTFEVSLNSSFYFPQTFQKKADDDAATSAIVQQILEENTRYWWRVTASDYYAESGYSEVQTFYVNAENELPTTFSLVEPGSPVGEDVTTQTPEFVWMLTTDPDPFDAISYTLFVAIDSNFSFVVSSPGIQDTSYLLGYQLEWEVDYWWKVSAEDLHDGITWSSEVFRFYTHEWTCGDADGNTIVEITDAVHLISYVFVPGSPAPDPLASGDADCNTIIEISDAVLLISYVFVPGSPPPCDPDNDGEPDC